MKILNLNAMTLQAAFRALGHEVLSAGHRPECDVHVTSPLPVPQLLARIADLGFTPDAVFYCDSSNLPYFPQLESLPWPSVFFSIDTYCNLWHPSYGHGFDAVLVAQKGHLELFLDQGIRAQWMPLFAREGFDRCRNLARDIPVAFVGTLAPKNIPDRKPFLTDFKREHPLFFTQGNYTEIFNRAAIVLNQTAASELNFRCFEAMACGAALLMEYSPHGLEELFTPEEHLLPLYPRGNARHAASIARDWLARPQELAALARRGHDEVQARHTDICRARTVVHLMEDLLRQEAHRQRLSDRARRRRLLSAAYGMVAVSLPEHDMEAYREYFCALSNDHA